MPTIALIFGGQSSEHEISCLTAGELAKEIDTEKYRVVGIGISKTGTWHRYEIEQIKQLAAKGDELPVIDDNLPAASVLRAAHGLQIANLTGDKLTNCEVVDCVFSVLHGTYGEDGTIQGLLEMFSVAYVGSGVASSAIGMDKHLMKVMLEAAELPVGPYQVILASQWPNQKDELCTKIIENLEFPVFVKPARGGSSVGITRVEDPNDLVRAIELARQYDLKVIVEQGFVGAREVECAVLGAIDGSCRSSKAGEIIVHTKDAFYDYNAKYLPKGQVELKIPAELDDELLAKVQMVAENSFIALGCEGLARVDTFINADGEVFVNEVNTMPGFTKLSMFPSLWKASGIEYRDLVTNLIEQALARPITVNR